MKDVTTVYRLWINGASEGDYTNRINAIRAAKAGLTKKPDFTNKIGGYTGRYNAGEAGYLYITTPEDGVVYMYGQKDYRNEKNTERC